MNVKKPIKIKNFISEQDSKIFIDYMDNNEAWFESWADGTIFNMYTGKDNLYNFGTDFNDQKYDSVRNLIIKYGEKIEKSIQENFPVDYPVYLTQFWMTKRKPGTFGRFHNDSDSGKNNQIKFSGIIYLNTLEIGGELSFPKLNYTYSPRQGDIILFESADPDFLHGVYPCKENRYVLPIWVTDQKEYALVK
jgi:hypothetical protein